jgi:hypothetical protein
MERWGERTVCQDKKTASTSEMSQLSLKPVSEREACKGTGDQCGEGTHDCECLHGGVGSVSTRDRLSLCSVDSLTQSHFKLSFQLSIHVIFSQILAHVFKPFLQPYLRVINHKNKSGIDSFWLRLLASGGCLRHSRLSLCSNSIQGSYQGLKAGQVPVCSVLCRSPCGWLPLVPAKLIPLRVLDTSHRQMLLLNEASATTTAQPYLNSSQGPGFILLSPLG